MMLDDVMFEGRKGRLSSRQDAIMDIASEQGVVSVEELAERFSVTVQTVRRDINRLADAGLLRRHHGGATLPMSTENVSYNTRKVLYKAEKCRIAEVIAEQIPNQSSIFLDIGTTSEEIALALLGHQGLKIITNNLTVATILAPKEDFEIILPSGVMRNRDNGLLGESTVTFINQFKMDYFILTLSGVDSDGTLLEFDYQEVQVMRAMMANCRQCFLAVDHSKFGRGAMVRIGTIAEVDAVFTDQEPGEKLAKVIADADVKLVVAS